MLDVATERTSAELVCADARQFDFGDTFKLVVASFDVVNNFLESTETLQPFVETVGRVLAPGGTFVCDIATETGMAEAHAGGRATIVRQDSIATLELLPQARDGQHDFLLRLLARVDRTTFTESSFTSSEWTRPTADVVASFQTLGETFVLGDRPGEPVDAQHRAWIVVGALAPRIRSATKAPRPRWGMPRRRRRR
jgi:SAM-dependent methyltransferase